jgi:hypothetical protein
VNDGDGEDAYFQQLSEICRELPEADEGPAWVGTRWRVRNNTFAHFLTITGGRPPSYAKSVGSDGPATVFTFRSSGLELEALRTMGLPFFRLPWQAPFVGLLLSATTDWDEVSELIIESYCLAAPKRLAALVDRPIVE